MSIRICVMAVLMVVMPLSHAQELRSAIGPQQSPKRTPSQTKAYNAGAEPFRCRENPNPQLRQLCADIERGYIQGEARRQGLPVPSGELVRLPAYGSTESIELGVACMGGTGMRRLSNGWEQLRNAKGEWLRCRDM